MTELRLDPLRTHQQLAKSLEQYGLFVQRACVRMEVTRKQVTQRHENKFSTENIYYYFDFVTFIRSVPWVRIKFSDEASFESRSEPYPCCC